MATARRFGSDGKELAKVDLPAEIFEAPVNEHLIWEAVKIHLGNQRQGTAKSKNRAAVSGGGRKPWKQKGTGRARSGSNTSPLWPGGGTAFGPQPRDYTARMNQKSRRAALLGALTVRAKDGDVIIVDAPAMGEPKTKPLAQLLKAVGLEGRKVLWVFDKTGEVLRKSSRNLDKVETSESNTLNTYELMHCECLILTQDGLKSLTERLSA
ncbi:MAG TPA: 50S ribosomal protein L4 [Candidatus Eisenbacteria bacterium]|nr:50S ribosomal protein L4 [Candidatus Eisenbacteria bacterium]